MPGRRGLPSLAALPLLALLPLAGSAPAASTWGASSLGATVPATSVLAAGAGDAASTGTGIVPPPAAPTPGPANLAKDSSRSDASRPDPVKAKLAARQERKLRTEYLKATAGIQGPTLKADSLLALLEDTNLVLIDVRQADEQAVSMIPHALTTADFAAKFRKGIPKTKRLVVYCTIGYRSGKYAMELARQGITAWNLEGGLLAWSHAGGPLEVRNAAGLATPTKRVHIYSSGWNFLHPDYEAVW